MRSAKMARRLVVDSNFLQRDELENFLAESPKNYAVLTDFAAMEAHKGNTLKSIFRSMEILSRYPRQVIILKDTVAVCGLRGREAGHQRRLIDQRQTRGFQNYCKHLDLARRGDKKYLPDLLEKGKAANENMDTLLDGAAKLVPAISKIAETFTVSELRILRRGEQFSDDMAKKFMESVLTVAGYMFADHPRVKKWPRASELPYFYIFRVSVCANLLAVRWIGDGGAEGVGLEKMRNDIVDMSFAAYASFFDGLLTDDKKLRKIYDQTVFCVDFFRGASK